jgi:hypothetical protein
MGIYRTKDTQTVTGLSWVYFTVKDILGMYWYRLKKFLYWLV